MLKLLSLVGCFLLTFSLSAAAQTAERDMNALIVRMQETENTLLTQRRQLLADEGSFAEPIWIKDENGFAHVVDGAALRAQIKSVTFLTTMLDLDDAVIANRSALEQMVAAMMSDEVRNSAMVATIYERLASASDRIRQQTLSEIDRQVEGVQEQFVQVLAARDALVAGTGAAQDTLSSGQTSQLRTANSGQITDDQMAGTTDLTAATNGGQTSQLRGTTSSQSTDTGNPSAPMCQRTFDDPTVFDAEWVFISWGAGEGFREIDGVICGVANYLGFITFDGTSWRSYRCDGDYVTNCAPDDYFNATVISQAPEGDYGRIIYRYDPDNSRNRFQYTPRR